MKPALIFLLAAWASVEALAQAGTAGGYVVSSKHRQAIISSGEALVAKPDHGAFKHSLDNTRNPFNLAKVDVPARHPFDGKSSEEILAELSKEIKATGSLVRGDNRVLLLGRELKHIGEEIKITVAGREFAVRLTDIQPRSFTIEYRDAQTSLSIR